MKFHLANFVLRFEAQQPYRMTFDGIYRVTLEGSWLMIEDSAGDEVLLVTSHPVTIRPIR